MAENMIISANGYYDEGYYPAFSVDVASQVPSNRSITIDGPNTYTTATLNSGNDASGTVKYTFSQNGYCYNCYCTANSTTPISDTEHTQYGNGIAAKLYDVNGNLVKDFGKKTSNSGASSLNCGTFLVYEGDYIIATHSNSSQGQRKSHVIKLTVVSFIGAN